MILSTSHNFIFVHVPKTAGTAMTAALESHAVTGTRTPLRRALRWLPVREAPDRAYFRKHETAAAMRAKLGPQVFDRFFRFTVVRNPFDHAVSHYEYLKEFRNPRKAAEFAAMSFADYLRWRSTARGLFVPSFSVLPDQAHWLVDGAGQLLVNRVMRFETLADDFAQAMEEVGLPGIRMKRINPTRAKVKGRSLVSYYDAATVAIVRRLYARDFDLFSYARDLPAV
ncbi:sulfotransferase family 2 domain-containing protein [Neotabrizicola sp. sgz301269]|uniref:sulfotransferase family 2 domain-containing protein n=1 Tax=Neotabrizicola sp. sgz301269 TaxID=3276282 RepID=UPI003770276A